MSNWEEERPIYEEEMTQQQKEEMVRAAKERREKEVERGRKIIFVMMAVYVAMCVLNTIFKLCSAEPGGRTGYMTLGAVDIILTALIAYNLYNGKKWAKMLFAVLIVFNILSVIGTISNLDIGRTDYSAPTSNVYVISSEGKAVGSWELAGTAELAKMQKQENARALMHRTLMAVSLVLLAIRAGYLYLLFFYRPIQEFFYRQESGV